MSDNLGGALPQVPVFQQEEAPKGDAYVPDRVVIEWDMPYRTLLGQRANTLAYTLWSLTYPHHYGVTWSQAYQDPNLREVMQKCYDFAEVVIRMLDVMTGFKPEK